MIVVPIVVGVSCFLLKGMPVNIEKLPIDLQASSRLPGFTGHFVGALFTNTETRGSACVLQTTK